MWLSGKGGIVDTSHQSYESTRIGTDMMYIADRIYTMPYGSECTIGNLIYQMSILKGYVEDTGPLHTRIKIYTVDKVIKTWNLRRWWKYEVTTTNRAIASASRVQGCSIWCTIVDSDNTEVRKALDELVSIYLRD